MELTSEILTFDGPIVLVGGGPIHFKLLAQLAHLPIFGMDGGADAVKLAGHELAATVGDMDSVAELGVGAIHTADQSRGDFEKTLDVINAPQYIVFGVLGARMDHSLEALRVLDNDCNRKVILVGTHDIAFRFDFDRDWHLGDGRRISFMSLGRTHVQESSGLAYPLDGLELSPYYQSLSNRTNAVNVRVSGQGQLIALAEVDLADRILNSIIR